MSDSKVQSTETVLNQNEVVEKKNSIKNRLRKVFILLSIGIILLMCIFSVVYFYFTNREDAINLIRNKVRFAEIFMENHPAFFCCHNSGVF